MYLQHSDGMNKLEIHFHVAVVLSCAFLQQQKVVTSERTREREGKSEKKCTEKKTHGIEPVNHKE